MSSLFLFSRLCSSAEGPGGEGQCAVAVARSDRQLQHAPWVLLGPAAGWWWYTRSPASALLAARVLCVVACGRGKIPGWGGMSAAIVMRIGAWAAVAVVRCMVIVV